MNRALRIVKCCAAQANFAVNNLDESIGHAIIEAAQQVIDGRLDERFPLMVWQTGSGTQSNMNANEVVAYLVYQRLGGTLREEAVWRLPSGLMPLFAPKRMISTE